MEIPRGWVLRNEELLRGGGYGYLLELHKCKARCAETCFSSALGPETEKQIQLAKNKIRFLGDMCACIDLGD